MIIVTGFCPRAPWTSNIVRQLDLVITAQFWVVIRHTSPLPLMLAQPKWVGNPGARGGVASFGFDISAVLV
jgi:hypothetical protein